MEKKSLLLKVYNVIFKGSLYLLFFLFPLFFMPFTTNAIEFNKQTLLTALVSISFFAWMLKSLVLGKIRFISAYMHIFVAVLLIVAAGSAYFSLYRYGSFWGNSSVFHESLLTIMVLVVLYFLITSDLKKKEIFHILSILLVSTFLSALFGIFQLFGKFLLTFDFSKTANFNTIGAVDALAVFEAIMLPITISMIMASKRVLRAVFIVFLIIDFALLILINFSSAWFVVIAGMLLVMSLGMQKKNLLDNRWLVLPMFFLAIAVLLFFFKFQIPGLAQRPADLYLKNKAGFEVSIKTIKESPVFGSGLGTFSFDYLKHKDDSLNKTVFWNFKTDSGGSKMITILATQGILGILSLFVLIVLFVFKGIVFFAKRKISDSEEKENSPALLMGIGIFSSFIALIVANFLYKSNMSLEFLFFSMMAFFLVLIYPEKKEITLKQSSLSTLFFSFCLTIVFISSLGVLIIEIQRYTAEVFYTQGLRSWMAGDNDNAIKSISKAVSINQKADIYLMDLSKAYLEKINTELNSSGAESNEKIQQYIKNSVNAASLAANLNPNNVSSWSVKGFVCQNLIGIVPGIDDWAIKSYDETIELEPLNPYFPTQQGITYLSKYSVLSSSKKEMTSEQEDLLNKAKERFEKAIELKSDFASARFQLAQTYKAMGKTVEAIIELEKAKTVASTDIGLAFQLGLVYYQSNDYDKAQKELERAVSLDDKYANALYFLGLVYDKKGDRDKAKSVIEKVLELNPNNEEIKKVLENLNSGKSALEGITEKLPLTAPVEENPEEIKKMEAENPVKEQ